MSAALDREGDIGGQTVEERPKLELVRAPESVEDRIAGLIRTYEQFEANLENLRLFLREYEEQEPLTDEAKALVEAENKRSLQRDIATLERKMHAASKELARLEDRTERTSGEFGVDPGERTIRELSTQVSANEAGPLNHNLDSSTAGDSTREYAVDSFALEQSVTEAPVEAQAAPEVRETKDRTKEALIQDLVTRRADLQEALRELATLNERVRGDGEALRVEVGRPLNRKISERMYQQALFERDQFMKARPAFGSPGLQRLSITNQDLITGQESNVVTGLREELSSVRAELLKEPKGLFAGAIGRLRSFFTAQPTWEERKASLETKAKQIEATVNEYDNERERIKYKYDDVSQRAIQLGTALHGKVSLETPARARHRQTENELRRVGERVQALQAEIEDLEALVRVY